MPTAETFKILQVVASLQGGAARHVVDLARALRMQGHEVALAAPEDDERLLEEIAESELEFFPINLQERFRLREWLRLRRLIKNEPWTHIHMHGHRAAFWARLARWRLETAPMIYTLHGYHPPFYLRRMERIWVNLLEWLLSRWTDAFICVSADTQRHLLRAVPQAIERCAVIENGITPLQINREERESLRRVLRMELGLPLNGFVIGTVARLQWQKGIDRLILALTDLLLTDRDYYLLLIGDGPEWEALQLLVEVYNVQDRVLFAGQRSDARRLYTAMDFFVLPSLWEGLPLTVLEAWDAGVPVIVTHVPGSRDLVNSGVDGKVVENSAQGLVEGVLALRRSPEHQAALVSKGHKRVELEFSLDRMVERTEKIYQFVLEQR